MELDPAIVLRHLPQLLEGARLSIAAFAVASLLALLALVTLALKSLLEWRHRDAIAAMGH